VKRAVVLVALAACGDNRAVKDAPPRPIDAAIDAGLPACANPVSGKRITMRLVAHAADNDAIVLVTSPPNDLRRFVVERAGTILIMDANDSLLPEPFIVLDDVKGGPVVGGGEMGLLGLAFHPHYATNRQFYVFYTRRATVEGDAKNIYRDVLARCTASDTDPDHGGAPTSCVEMLVIPDFAGNHNGGMIEFGPDGYLYIGTGDGGSANDPNHDAQAVVTAIDPSVPGPTTANVEALLGKILRIDVDHPAPGKPYGIPADNPFAAGGGEPEIFAIGLRNPWRWSFDRATGDIWIGDVGQGTREELDWVKAGFLKGKNFGWSVYEATFCRVTTGCPTDMFVPQDERTHAAPPLGDGWTAIIGGQVYRGTCYPDIVGTYFYTDNGAGGLASAVVNPDGRTLAIADVPGSFPRFPASLHADARGELYETDIHGNVYHLEAAP
jgi:glucose/arabinose dehydrogenase